MTVIDQSTRGPFHPFRQNPLLFDYLDWLAWSSKHPFLECVD